MDAVAFISDSLAQVHLRLMATCEGLNSGQLLWRPAPTANNIGFILRHRARNEDARITNTGKLAEDIWANESWYEKFDQPVTAPDPERPDLTVAGSLRHLITQKNNHHGQIDYLRGLQEEAWDLPRDTVLFCPSLPVRSKRHQITGVKYAYHPFRHRTVHPQGRGPG